jgi:CheY-like chemotaxis protein
VYAPRSHPRRRLSPAHIVLAEDDYELRRMLAGVLIEDGYQVTELCDGGELLDYVTSYGLRAGAVPRADLIISDVRMPKHGGLEVLAGLRRARFATPVVLITAFPEADTLAAAEALGAVTVLDKPFEIDDLRMVVLNLLN